MQHFCITLYWAKGTLQIYSRKALLNLWSLCGYWQTMHLEGLLFHTEFMRHILKIPRRSIDYYKGPIRDHLKTSWGLKGSDSSILGYIFTLRWFTGSKYAFIFVPSLLSGRDWGWETIIVSNPESPRSFMFPLGSSWKLNNSSFISALFFGALWWN